MTIYLGFDVPWTEHTKKLAQNIDNFSSYWHCDKKFHMACSENMCKSHFGTLLRFWGVPRQIFKNFYSCEVVDILIVVTNWWIKILSK